MLLVRNKLQLNIYPSIDTSVLDLVSSDVWKLVRSRVRSNVDSRVWWPIGWGIERWVWDVIERAEQETLGERGA